MVYLVFSSQAKMVQSIVQAMIKKDYPTRDECNYVSYDMGLTPLNELVKECGFLPLGYEKKAVLAENCSFLAKTQTKFKYQKGDVPDSLLAYLQNPDPAIDLYLMLFSGDIDPKNDMVKAVKANGEIKEVKEMTPDQWPVYIESYFVKRGYAIDRDAIKELYKRTDGDFAAFLNEAQKLMCYSGGDKIDLKMVTAMVSPKLDDDAFHMSNALTRGDSEAALRIYRDLKVHSVEEIRLVNLLANQFIYMDQVRFLDAKGLSSPEIAKELGGSPIRADITRRSLYRIKEADLLKTIESLYQLDFDILSGHVESKYAFTLFLANFGK